MAGEENLLDKNSYSPNENDGLILRSVRYLWQKMSQSKDKFFVKSSFIEIYNECIKDLLTPNNKNLNCRLGEDKVS